MAAVVVAMGTVIPAAPAEFRYVPPTEEIEAATEIAGGAPDQPVHAAPGGWRVHAGETLREALDRWGARAGIDVLFLTDRRYRLGEARTFEGEFGEAARALFAALAHLPRPPAGELSGDGRTLTILHRAPNAGGER